MKRCFVNFPFYLGLILLVISCNQNSADKPALKDTTATDTVIQTTDMPEGEIDYSKTDINLTQQEWAAFKQKYLVNDKAAQQNEKISGDFNGDGKKETIFIVPPVEDTITKNAFQECIGGCNSYLVSSDTAILILKVDNNLGGEIKNVGDIDGDGADDIMVYPSWWQSNWNAYKIYSMNISKHSWSYLIEPITIFANELENHILFVKKGKQPGYISAYNSTSDAEGEIKSSYKDYKILK
jgi:hypothetical protein